MPLDDKILQRLRDNDKTLTSLNLKSNKISETGLKELAVALANNTTLRLLNLGYNKISDMGLKELTGALVNNTNLTSLNLGSNKISDANKEYIGLINAYLARNKLINEPALTSLNLKYNKMSEEGLKVLAEALVHNTTLTSLELGYKQDEISAAGKEYVGFINAYLFRNMLVREPIKTSLSLGYNKISDVVVKEVAKVLVSNTTLTSLDIRENKISDEGVKEVAKVLVSNNTLKSLDLGNNQISDAGAKVLALALQKNTALTSLNLQYNKINCAGARKIAHALASSGPLTSLGLNGTKIGDVGAQALAEALKKNNNLTSLSLYNNQIGSAGIESFIKMLRRNITLICLDLGSNNIDRANELTKLKALLVRNKQYLKELQTTACMTLMLGRLLLYKDVPVENGVSSYFLPLEIREKIVAYTGENALMTEEQQRLVLNYAKGNIVPVADKLSFFKITKCDRVMKPLNISNRIGEPPTKKARTSLSSGSE